MQNKIEIYSPHTFNVYKELSFEDQSLDIEKAKIVNTQQLIRVLPTFTRNLVKIRQGSHKYNEDIIYWPTIRSLIKQGTIKLVGASINEYPTAQEKAEEAKPEPKKRQKAVKAEEVEEKEIPQTPGVASLDELAGEE